MESLTMPTPSDFGVVALTTATVTSVGTFLGQADADGLFDAISNHGFTLVFAGVCLGVGVLALKLFSNYIITEHTRIVTKLDESERRGDEKDERLVTLLQTTIKEAQQSQADLAAAINRFCETRPCLLDRADLDQKRIENTGA